MPETVVLLSAGQPSSNPRLVKEATALSEKGYVVTVLYSYWAVWADESDNSLFKEYPKIQWVRVGGHPRDQKIRYWYTRLRSKCFNTLAGFVPRSVFIQQQAYGRCFPELKALAIQQRANLYIAHNLGALAPAAIAAKRNNSKYGFDAEDYYRGQQNDKTEIDKVRLLEDAYLPDVAYSTAASPLIAEQYKVHYPVLDPVLINNVFPKQYLKPKGASYHKGEALKLFWFSQTTGRDRGLEEVIEAMGQVESAQISLTIVGSAAAEIKDYFYALAATHQVNTEDLHFHEPVGLAEIFSLAARHHAGLALETNGTLNRRLCLTNKIFTYLLSGLAVIATNTPAQEKFMSENRCIGRLYMQGNIDELARLLETLIQDPEVLNNYRQNAQTLAATTFNWENEKPVFLKVIANTLSTTR